MEELSTPALLRLARRPYTAAVRGELDAAGCGDLPRNGPFLLGALARGTTPLAGVIDALGVSKQAAGALVDALAVRGYLLREIDPADRRRLTVRLTDRGQEAVAAVRRGIGAVDAHLSGVVGPDALAQCRAVLLVLAGGTPGDG